MPGSPLYDGVLGGGYAELRRADPRIAAQVGAALGSGGLVVNVGAGAGSYEPASCVALEPSRTMLAQRPAGSAPAVQGVAGALPFRAGAFEGGLAVFTVHHWPDVGAGLSGLVRVVRGGSPIVVLTWDVDLGDRYWLVDEYLPAARTLDRSLPSPDELLDLLGGEGRVEIVPVPRDCTDGFFAAWWCRPEAYLDARVRAAISGIARLPPADVDPGIERLRRDLASGAWYRRHADLLEAETFDACYRLVVAASPGP